MPTHVCARHHLHARRDRRANVQLDVLHALSEVVASNGAERAGICIADERRRCRLANISSHTRAYSTQKAADARPRASAARMVGSTPLPDRPCLLNDNSLNLDLFFPPSAENAGQFGTWPRRICSGTGLSSAFKQMAKIIRDRSPRKSTTVTGVVRGSRGFDSTLLRPTFDHRCGCTAQVRRL